MKRAEERFDMERENEKEKERVWWQEQEQEQEQGQDELAILLSFGVGAVSARALDASPLVCARPSRSSSMEPQPRFSTRSLPPP